MAVMSRKVPEWRTNMCRDEEMQQCESRSGTEMEQKLLLCVFMTLIEVSLAVWQRVTAIRGQTVDLSCPIRNFRETTFDWKNPEGHIMFFAGGQVFQGAVSERYILKKLSTSEFTISITDVTVKDGGNYTCFHYDHQVIERKVELTVIDPPKIIKTKHRGRFDLKCTAQANYPPPLITWKLDNGPEILAQSQLIREDKAFVSSAILTIQAVEDRVAVTCLVHHPALYTQPLKNFVILRGERANRPRLTTSSLKPFSTQGRTTTVGTVGGSSSESSTPSSTVLSTHLGTHSASTEAPHSSVTSVSSNVSVHRGSSDSNLLTGRKASSPLLVFLVTCLIVALLVVVIFFAIKLRRAHVAWKKENEDSDPSEESSKSKSSQEEKKCQGQNSRGLIKTMFTQYVVEQPTSVTSVINTAAMTSAHDANKEQTLQPQPTTRAAVTFNTKETDL
uniref:Ig-like domain-containing protein n=2 Tax=Takifugu rubripes TaxID=31033 RepID=A0A674NGU7_TAKRU